MPAMARAAWVLPRPALEKLYTEKISSRLSAFVPCLFAGQDIRSQKAQEV